MVNVSSPRRMISAFSPSISVTSNCIECGDLVMFHVLTLVLLMNPPIDHVENALVAKYGEAQRARIQRGLEQAARFWRAEDGDATAFEQFATTNFAGDQQTLDELFKRMEFVFES